MSIGAKLCFDRYLPSEPLLRAEALNPRFSAVIFYLKLWPNGTTLRVRFMGGTFAQRQLALQQAAWWSDRANIRFVESDDGDAEIRVTFDPSDGAWSYLGTDCRSIPTNQPTMNLGFQDGGTSAHEFGHALGLGHEHQNPSGGIVWNEAEVIRDLSGPPNNWSVDQIRHNVLRKYSTDLVRGTQFDRGSIMLYAFPSRWTMNGVGTSSNEVLSETDRSFIASIYPKPAAPVAPETGAVRVTVGGPAVAGTIGKPGEEDLFAFTVSEEGHHVVETTGKTDVVMKLYGPDSPTRLVAEDDDGGAGLNPRITRSLLKGEYLVQLRHYNRARGTGPYEISVRR